MVPGEGSVVWVHVAPFHVYAMETRKMPLEPAPTPMQNEVVVQDALVSAPVVRVRRKAERLDTPRGAVPLQGDGSARAAARATDSLAEGGARAGHAVEAGPVRARNGRSRHQGPGGSVPLLHEDRTGARHGRITHGDAERRRRARDADERVRGGADHRRQGHRRPCGPVPELRVRQEAGRESERRNDARRGAARDRDAERRRHAGHGAGHRTGRRRRALCSPWCSSSRPRLWRARSMRRRRPIPLRRPPEDKAARARAQPRTPSTKQRAHFASLVWTDCNPPWKLARPMPAS